MYGGDHAAGPRHGAPFQCLGADRIVQEILFQDGMLILRVMKNIPDYDKNAHAWKVQVSPNRRQTLYKADPGDERILAIDPGFRSGCKIVALDEFGNVLERGVMHVIGGAEKLVQGRAALADMIRRLGISIVAIGNGSACRPNSRASPRRRARYA